MRSRSWRTPIVGVCGLVAATLMVPASAFAHQVNAAESSASCAAVGTTATVTLKVRFEGFADANKPVSGTVALDGAVVKTFSDVTWDGSDFTLVYTQATTAGSHEVRGDFSWPGKSAGENGGVAFDVNCSATPSVGIAVDKTAVETTAVAGTTVHFVVAVKNTGDTVFAKYSLSDPNCVTLARTGANADDASLEPGEVWTYACAMTTQPGQTAADNTATATGENAQGQSATASDSASVPLTQPGTTPGGGTTPVGGTTPSGTTPVSGTVPGGAVLPQSIVSGRARLRGPSGCVERAFRARVSGRRIARVGFYVDGRLVKTITGRHAVYSVKVRPSRYGIGRHRVVARVRFVKASGTAARQLRLTFRRCAAGAVAPRFTG